MVNRVTLLGNIGKDAEKISENVTKFSLATTERWKDQSGAQQEKTEWHRVTVLGKLAPLMYDLCKQGKKAYVEGKLQTSSWEKDGEKRYSTDVVVDFGGRIELIGSPSEKSESSGNYTPSEKSSSQKKSSPKNEQSAPREEKRDPVLSNNQSKEEHSSDSDIDAYTNDDDIPF